MYSRDRVVYEEDGIFVKPDRNFKNAKLIYQLVIVV